MLVCHFEMLSFGARCVLFPSTRGGKSYFEEEMASTLREGQPADTEPFLTMVSINVVSNISIKYWGQVLARALDRLGFTGFVLNLEQPHSFSKPGVTLMGEASSETTRDV